MSLGSRAESEPESDGARQDIVQAIMNWAQTYAHTLMERNRDKLTKDHPLIMEEIFFRIAYAINSGLINFMMGPEISMIQNAIAVVASMTRVRFYEAEPSILSFLESAHDMLRRLDPLLWRNFSDVIRYVLPLKVRLMSNGWENVQEIASILNGGRRAIEATDIYPLSIEFAGYAHELLAQENLASAQSMVRKKVSDASKVHGESGALQPLRFYMSR
jgi:hypothetical protein